MPPLKLRISFGFGTRRQRGSVGAVGPTEEGGAADSSSESSKNASKTTSSKKSSGGPSGRWTEHFSLYDGDTSVSDVGDATTITSDARLAMAEDDWREFGDALGNATKLKNLHLQRCGISDGRTAGLLFGEGRSSRTYPLRVFTSRGNRFGPRGLEVVLRHVGAVPTLRHLSLNEARFGREEVALLASALRDMKLTTLKLRENGIDDASVEALLAVDGARHLRTLSLLGNDIGKKGLASVARFLGRDDAMLQHLDVSDNRPMDEAASRDFADSLPRTTRLVSLCFGNNDDANDGTFASMPRLERLVCDASSFASLCASNHTLKDVWVSENGLTLSPGPALIRSRNSLREALEINGRDDVGPNGKLRFKLREFYFRRSAFDVRPFADLDVRLLPRVLEFATMSVVRIDGSYVKACKGDLDGTYRLLRNLDFPGSITSETPEEARMRRYEERISEMQRELERLARENRRIRRATN